MKTNASNPITSRLFKKGKITVTTLLLFLLAITCLARTSALAKELTGWIEAPIQLQNSVAVAWINLPDDPSRLTVTVWPEDQSGTDAGAVIPSRLHSTTKGDQIIWQVPPSPSPQGIGEIRRFRFRITAADASGPVHPSLTEDAANLIANGNFKEIGPKGIPTGVARLDGLRLLKGESENAIAFDVSDDGNGPVFRSQSFAVTGGQAYTVSFRYALEKARAHPRYRRTLLSHFISHNSEGKRLKGEAIFSTRETGTDGWKRAEAVITAPPQATTASVTIRNGSTVPYSVRITDLRVAPLTIAKARLDGEATQQTASPPPEASPERSRRFNFGTERALPWNGFVPVSPKDGYTREKGWGFAGSMALKAFDNLRPDGLSRDFITATKARFRVDLPNGRYAVWLLIGESSAGKGVKRFYFDQFLSVNNETLHKLDPRPSEWIRAKWLHDYSSFWVPGMDYYDTFIRPAFEDKQTVAEVTDGKLLIAWRNLPVSALMLQPVESPVSMEQAIATVAADRRRDTHIAETPLSESEVRFEPLPDEIRRGFVLYRQGAEKAIHPTTIPAPEERIAQLQTFAAPGQDESVLFSLHALKDLDPVEIKTGELTGEQGTLPADTLDIRVARYLYRNTNAKGPQPNYRYQLTAIPFDKRNNLPVVKGYNWTWRIDIRVPEATPAGIYTGVVRIVNAQGELASLPLQVRILPFTLDPLPILQGFFYDLSEPAYSAFRGANVQGRGPILDDPAILEQIKTNERRELAFMKSLGLNSAALGDVLQDGVIYRDGEVHLKPGNRLDLWMDLYTEAGFGPMPFYGFHWYGAKNDRGSRLSTLDPSLKPPFTQHWYDAYRSMARNLNQHARSRNWPEIIWHISDELSNHGQSMADLGAKVAASLKDLPDIRTIASVNSPREQVMAPQVDILMPNYAYPITEGVPKALKETGTELWIYNSGGGRINLGLWTWRVGVKGRYQWHYRSQVTNPWDDAGGGGLSHYCLAYPTPDGPLPSVQSDAARAAITDHRYMATLERVMAGAEGNPAKAEALKAAKAFVDDLRQRIPFDPRELLGYNLDPRDTGGDVGGAFGRDDTLQRIRWAMVEHILNLQQ
ncbi:MAG TPA: hypothetical protein VNQ90_18595 [Chthoniobacteraceae bacterium]|nr:hypothetical protein [Chthoniobacteraceae bacterium]